MNSPRRLMKNFNSTDRVNLFAGQAPDLVALRIRIRCIALMHQIVQ